MVSPTKRLVFFSDLSIGKGDFEMKYHQSLGFLSVKRVGSLQQPADIGRIDSLMKWRK